MSARQPPPCPRWRRSTAAAVATRSRSPAARPSSSTRATMRARPRCARPSPCSAPRNRSAADGASPSSATCSSSATRRRASMPSWRRRSPRPASRSSSRSARTCGRSTTRCPRRCAAAMPRLPPRWRRRSPGWRGPAMSSPSKARSAAAWRKSKQLEGQPIRTDGPEGHLVRKKGTPTMGGVLILLALIVSTLLWADLGDGYVWVTLLVTVGFGGVGFFDDYKKLTRRSSSGLSSRGKLAAQVAISAVAAVAIIYLTRDPTIKTAIAVPFFKNVLIELGWFFVAAAVFVIAGASNAVNLTDGLDGLAIVPTMIAAGCFALIAYLSGNANFANYLQIHFVPGAGELAVFCAALIGSGLGFHWYNAPPAMVFMGDTGSLSLGGA